MLFFEVAAAGSLAGSLRLCCEYHEAERLERLDLTVKTMVRQLQAA